MKWIKQNIISLFFIASLKLYGLQLLIILHIQMKSSYLKLRSPVNLLRHEQHRRRMCRTGPSECRHFHQWCHGKDKSKQRWFLGPDVCIMGRTGADNRKNEIYTLNKYKERQLAGTITIKSYIPQRNTNTN